MSNKSMFCALSTLLSNPRRLTVSPRINAFLMESMRIFKVRNAGGPLIIHSHLPPLSSATFVRFPALILLVKFTVDGLIGVAAFALNNKMKEATS